MQQWLDSGILPLASRSLHLPTGVIRAFFNCNENLAPDWLRVGTDIVGGNQAPTFNATFTLSGAVVPEPGSVIMLSLGSVGVLGVALVRRRRAMAESLRSSGWATRPAAFVEYDRSRPGYRRPICFQSRKSAIEPIEPIGPSLLMRRMSGAHPDPVLDAP